MNLKIVLSGIVALAGSSMAAKSSAPFVRASSHRTTSTTGSTSNALSLRGGAGPLDADTVSKVYTGIVAAQGALDYLSPKTVNKLYNCDLSDSISSFIQTFVGGNQAATAIALFGTIFADQPSLKAIGIGLIPASLSSISAILDGTPKELGINVPMQYINLGIQLFVIKSLLGGDANASQILKYYLGYIVLATGQCRVAPQSALKAWGFPDGTALQSFATKLLGQSGLAFSAVAYTLGVEGGNASTAVGRVALVYLASLIEFLASGEFEKIGVDITKCYPWIAISAVTAATLLF